MQALATRPRIAGMTALALTLGLVLTAAASDERSALLDTSPCPGPGYRVLIAQADAFGGVDPTMLRNALLADPDVEVVDFFNACEGTPTPAQLETYDIVFTYSSFSDGYQDPVAMGDNLADYVDRGGIVFTSHLSLYPLVPLSIQGRWLTDGYSPHAYSPVFLANDVTLAPANRDRHPLLNGVTTLTAGFRLNVMVATGATHVATYTDGSSALAAKGRAIGMPVYLGNLENPGTGDYARVIANAGRWLEPRVCPAPDGDAGR